MSVLRGGDTIGVYNIAARVPGWHSHPSAARQGQRRGDQNQQRASHRADILLCRRAMAPPKTTKTHGTQRFAYCLARRPAFGSTSVLSQMSPTGQCVAQAQNTIL